MRLFVAAALLAGTACTLANPFGTECLSDENCGCANCCISWRCTAYGAGVDAGDPGADAGGAWVVSTLAGGTQGTQDGQGTAAQFNGPWGLALDGAGNLYVADTGNNCVRKVTPDGTVSTLAPAQLPCGGTGLNNPIGVAVDAQNNVYVADTGDNCVKRIAANGTVSVLTGLCTQQSFSCSDSPTPAEYEQPAGLAWAPPYLFISEGIGNRLRSYRLSDGFVGTVAGKGSSTQVMTDGPCSFGNSCGASSAAAFYGPNAMAVGANGTLYIADDYNCAIRKVTTTPACSVVTLGSRANCPTLISQQSLATLINPNGLTVGTGAFSNLVFVGDTGNNRVAALDTSGTLLHIAGARAKGMVDGAAADARFNHPTGMAMDPQGRLFVVDSGNNRIRVLTWVTP